MLGDMRWINEQEMRVNKGLTVCEMPNFSEGIYLHYLDKYIWLRIIFSKTLHEFLHVRLP